MKKIRIIAILLLSLLLQTQISILAVQTDANLPEIGINNKQEKLTKSIITDNIFNDVKLFNSMGDEINNNDIIPNMSGFKMDLTFSFDGKNYQAGDTFSTVLPKQININKDLSGDFSPISSAKWSINSSTNTLTITFIEDNVANAEYKLSLITSLKKVNNSDEEMQKLIFDTSPNKKIYNLEISSVVNVADSRTLVTINPFNPKTAEIKTTYNLDRSNANDRSFIIEGYQYSSLAATLSDLKVYSNDVDFNGQLSGDKTELVENVDYTIALSGQNSTMPSAKIVMLKSLNKKAIIVTGIMNNIDGTNYIDKSNSSNEYNYIYGYAKTVVSDNTINQSSNSQYFVTGQPLAATGEKNKDTGYLDWTIEYNFNEQPLTTLSKLTSMIEDNGIEYVPGSLQVIKVNLKYDSQNNYDVVEGNSGLSDFNTSIENNGSFDMTYKGKSNQAYIIKYSTKITNSDERIVKNKISNSVQTVTPSVNLIPNLLYKESGIVDLYNQTMEWTITVNNEKSQLKNVIVHDYFIGKVVDYTNLDVSKKISNTLSTPLSIGVDYTVERFDENGNPLGVRPEVNGAPKEFNGGIRIRLIGEYATLNDTVDIKIKTKVDSDSKTTVLKNKATLNCDGVPGVIEYDSTGSYDFPYYQGGSKISGTAYSDEQYLNQNWLVFVNAKGNNYTDIDFEDVIPSGLELVPNSLRFEEVTSSAMVDDITKYLNTDVNLATQGDDVYPTSLSVSDNTIKLKFNKLGTKKVYVKYKTRTAKKWYISKSYLNTAKVSFDSDTYNFTASQSVYNYEYALEKRVAANSTSDNVADWSIYTRNITQYLSVTDPVIKDSLEQNGTRAIYDPTSFNVIDTATGKQISSSFYDLVLTKTNFTITFKNYTATSNIKVTYKTISEFPGLIKNSTLIESASYGTLDQYYRSDSISIPLTFTNGSGSGIVKTGDFTIKKVDANDQTKLLPGAIFEIYTLDDKGTGLKATTDDNGLATFENIPYDKYLVKEIKAPDKYQISEENKKGKAVTISNELPTQTIIIENSLAPTLGNVELSKIDSKTKQALAGAVFKIIDKDNKIVAQGLKSDNNGKLVYNNILSGEYKFVETSAPKNYQLDSTPLSFKIDIGQVDTVKVSMTNTKKPTGKVIIDYVDTNYKPIAKQVTLKGIIGESFKITELNIPGYKLKKIDGPKILTSKSNVTISNTYKTDDQIITYIYEKDNNKIDYGKDYKPVPKTGISTTEYMVSLTILLFSSVYLIKRRNI